MKKIDVNQNKSKLDEIWSSPKRCELPIGHDEHTDDMNTALDRQQMWRDCRDTINRNSFSRHQWKVKVQQVQPI
jgi:hypothetical protein